MPTEITWIPDEHAPVQPACRKHPRLHPDAWFPGVGSLTPDNQAAIAACHVCPLLDACREWALTQPLGDVVGIWGGTTAVERKRMARDSIRECAE